GVPQESYPGERRVALDPASVKRLRQAKMDVVIECGAGTRAGFTDEEYLAAGAVCCEDREAAFQADMVLQVRALGTNLIAGRRDLDAYRLGQWIVGFWDPLGAPFAVAAAAEKGVHCVALELIPRTTRAQSMDALSSMATLVGYRAVLLAATELPRVFPLLMTAAGTLSPARVLVIGAGVAGLQAMATAKRLGAVVDGYDIRPAAREQVESVGARFAEVPLEATNVEVEGGYAREMDHSFQSSQQSGLARHIAAADVVITTAMIPGRPSPLLISEDAVRRMRPGSVIVDVAAERGGNCPLTRADERVQAHGVTILGPTNASSDLPYHASQMLGRNLSELVPLLAQAREAGGALTDEIARAAVITGDYRILNPQVHELSLRSLEEESRMTRKAAGP
ncbi:MAG TPA: NAD(P) transhydrogenase subunit alpha, partial [Pirellulaceae bacterium]